MRRLRAYLPYAALVVEVLLFYRKVLFSSQWGIPWDLRGYHLPLATYIAGSLKQGQLPLWDPYTYCGNPFYANLQTQLFYPLAWPAFIAGAVTGGRSPLDLLEWQIALHVLLGGVFTYLLLRKLNAGRAGATLGATLFQLGGYFASQTQHLGAMNAGSWLPLAWLCILELRERLKVRWLTLLALSLSMAFLCGFPPVAAVVYVSCASLVVVLVVLRRAPWKVAVFFTVACVWSATVSAVLLLPGIEMTRWSTASLRAQWAGEGGGVPLQGLVSLVVPDHYHLFDLSRYTLPWNPTFLYLYCSILGLLLAMAVVLFRRSPYWAVFGLVTLFSALWMLGESTPVGTRAYRLLPDVIKPPLYPEFAMLSFTLGVAVLAGLGAEAFVSPRGRWLSVLAVAVVAGDLIVVGSGRPMNTGPNDPWIVTPDRFEGSSEAMARLRQLVNQTSPPSRVETVNGAFGWYTSASVTQVPTADGDDPMALLRLLRVRLLFCKGDAWARHYEPSQLDSPVMSLLNVRYVISRLDAPPGSAAAGLRRLGPVDGQYIFENENVLPRFFLVGRVESTRNMEEGLSVMRKADFDPRALAVVEGAVDLEGASGGEVSVTRYAREEVVLQVNAPAAGYLVTSEAYYPGWRAYLDGVERPLFITNVAFRGLPVPAGKHTITMRFQPRILVWGAGLSALGAGLLMAALVFGDNMREASAMDFVEQLKSSVDIVKVVGEYVRLRKSGAGPRYTGLCPFHTEKTPSFSVHQSHQFYKCFGCGAGGDVLRFVMEIERLSFYEALKLLADRNGIPMPKRAEYSDDETRQRAALFEMHEMAARAFRSNLNGAGGAAARAYLEKRGVSPEVADEFDLGLSLRPGQDLVRRFEREGYKPDQMEASGLVLKRQDGSGFYDRFRGRLMFPIHSESGKVIGFGGRALSAEDEPKYLNSPETPIYKKSQVLFNLHRAKEPVRKADCGILVEGYMDVIGLHSGGVREVVASCGTALTSAQVRALKRHSEKIVINFDPDEAGSNAAERSVQMLLEEGMRVRVLELEGGLDPDEFVKQSGAAAYNAALERAPGYFQWLADRARGRYDMRSGQGRVSALQFLLPAIQRVGDKLERAAIAAEVAGHLGVEPGLVLEHFRKAAAERSERPMRQEEEPLRAVEITLLNCLLLREEIRETIVPKLREMPQVEQFATARIFHSLFSLYDQGPRFRFAELEARLEESDKALLASVAFADKFGKEIYTPERALACLKRLDKESHGSERASLKRRMTEAERAGNWIEVRRLNEELRGLEKAQG